MGMAGSKGSQVPLQFTCFDIFKAEVNDWFENTKFVVTYKCIPLIGIHSFQLQNNNCISINICQTNGNNIIDIEPMLREIRIKE